MKNAVLLFLLSCLFFGCNKDSEARLKIKEAEELIMSEKLDSAFVLLESIANPDVLNDKAFAHWCLVYARVCEQLGEDMPFVSQLKRTAEYYESYGSAEEKVQCMMHLGQAYEDEKNFDQAMEVYLQTVDLAKSEKIYKSVGKLYNRIAQLHKFDDSYDEAQRFYQMGGEYYRKAKDSLDYIYSIRDIGWLYTLKEEYGQASEFYLKAFQLALNLNDSLLLSSITNRMGNNYLEMGNYSLAEKYLLQSIAYDEAGSAPTYLALANLYTLKKEYTKVRSYIDMAIQYSSPQRSLVGGKLYRLYMLEKSLGNYILSLKYYEQFMNFADSIAELQNQSNMLKIERRYEHEMLLGENKTLEDRNILYLIIGISLLLFLILLFCRYKYKMALKNKDILIQRITIHDANIALEEKEFAIKGLNNAIFTIRENILKTSDVYKKIMKNALSIEDAKKNPLTQQDWLELEEKIGSTYFTFFNNLASKIPDLTDKERHFCCLLKIGLNNQQLSILLSILPGTVSHIRYGIMKKGRFVNTKTTLEKIIFSL